MATKPISNFSASWNESKTYSGIGLHVTDTAGTSQSKLLNLTINGQSKFSVDKVGNMVTTYVSASHVTASGVKINTFNTNKIITNTISASYLSASVFITSNFSPSKVTATNISASYITASGLKISTFSTDKIVSTRISASYLSASSLRTGNFNPSKVTTTNISASYISASKLKVGNFPAGKKITFADGTTANIITPKLRAFSASISYLEMMTGSISKINFPTQQDPGKNITVGIDSDVTKGDSLIIRNPSTPGGGWNSESYINEINVVSPRPGVVDEPLITIRSIGYKNGLPNNPVGQVSINGGKDVTIVGGAPGTAVDDPNVPREPGNVSIIGKSVNIGNTPGQAGNIEDGGYADDVNIGGRNINLTPSGSSNCVKINGCLEISGNLVAKGGILQIGPNSLYLSSSNSSSRIYGTGLTVSSSYITASAINAHTASLTNVEIFSLVGTNISASYISASNLIVGKFPTGKQVVFSDESKPSLLTDKLRAFTASISYLEMTSGSDAKILFPKGKLLIASENSSSGFILDNTGKFWFTDSLTASLSGANCDKPSTIAEFANNILRRPTYIKGSPKGSPKDESKRGFSIGNACGEYMNFYADAVTKCMIGTYNNFDVSSQFTKEELNAVPEWARKNIYSGSNTLQFSICIDGCKTKFSEKVVGNSNFRIYPISRRTMEINTCTSGCLDIYSDQKVLGSERERDHTSFCVDTPTSKVGNKSNIKVAARSLLANDEQSLYTVKVEDYNDTTDDLKNRITASAVGGNYAAAAQNLGYSIPLPSYAEVSSSVYDIKYTFYPKSVKDNWYNSTGTNFYVDAVDIQSGSFIQGVGPTGNKLRISADKITANTLSASNFSVSGGLVSSNLFSASNANINELNVHTGSFTNVEINYNLTITGSLILDGHITASNEITASSAGVSTGKYAKIKIGNQIYKILLYADS